MGPSKFSYQKLALAVMLASGVLAGCSDSDGINKTTPVAPPEAKAIVNPVTLIFQGIDSGILTNQQINFTLAGSEKDYLFVLGATKNADGSYDLTPGSGTVMISRGDNAAVEDFSLDLHATSPGYFATGMSILIPAQKQAVTGKEGASYEIIFTPLAPDANTTAGVTAKQATAKAPNGVLQEALELVTDVAADNAPNKATVGKSIVDLTVPANTRMTDDQGNPVEGNITANIVYFSNEPEGAIANESVLDAFPGGLSPSTVLGEDGNPNDEYDEITFVSAGFTAIQIQNDKGDIVSNFDRPVPLTFNVAKETLDLEGNPITKGGTIPLWSYNEKTGQWKSEGVAKIEDVNPDGTFKVTQNIKHLSYYNLDYYGRRCRANITFKEANGNDYNPRVIFTRNGGGWNRSIYISGMDTHTFYNIPDGSQGELKVVSRSDYTAGLIKSISKNGAALTLTADKTYEGNFCDLDGATIEIESPSTKTLNVSLQSKCNDTGETKAQPGVVYVYGKNYHGYYGAVTPTAVTPGTMRLEEGDYLLSGRIYTEKYGSQVDTKNIIISDNSDVTLTFPIDKCGTTTTGTTGTTGASGGSGA
ncbi:hypothetical protein [Photobacterium sp. TY1-4]|uniref:hypothetical protein n=1 Tax=Photobacterium sp. TY1-4 TaxID=2899122 RepID=UPI0021C0C7A2|nr:hypothetical protein [Photobacterium sp. TY1-4]UXI03521.1 hypothetical protein NH461_24180 [Photobacterium sp. TY1-4]